MTKEELIQEERELISILASQTNELLKKHIGKLAEKYMRTLRIETDTIKIYQAQGALDILKIFDKLESRLSIIRVKLQQNKQKYNDNEE